jgi:hypothetical protein
MFGSAVGALPETPWRLTHFPLEEDGQVLGVREAGQLGNRFQRQIGIH